jgi:3-deoxy-D-manno-octulosonic-acid transferase
VTRFLYTLLLRLLFPLIFIALTVRGWRSPRAAIPWAERLAWRMPARPAGDRAPVWVHAVSLGEVQAAQALVVALAEREPSRPLLFTVGTLTGMQRAQASLARLQEARPGRLVLAFAPFDFPGAVRRFLDHFRPVSLLLLEMEIWPNWLAACDARGIPVGIASARLSLRSAYRYQRHAKRLMLPAMRRVRVIAAQSEGDAERFVAVGVPPERVKVGGNLKFDFALPTDLASRGSSLRGLLGGRRVWVAGSTHEGEEAACLATQRRLEQRFGRDAPVLVLVPRIVGRFDSVAEWLRSEGVAFARRSQGAPPLIAGCNVLLVDTLGELMGFYAAAEVAFVGGTLVPVGGHNLLEPAALGLALVCGPHTHSAPQVAQLLAEAGGLQVVDDVDGLASAVEGLFADVERRVAAGEAARSVVESNRGAVARCLELLAPVLP